MDLPQGLLLEPGNLPNWWNFPIRDRVSHYCQRPVTYANDANAAAYGEFWRGAGREHQSMVLLTLGTGIGGGIVVGDMLIEGQHSCGGECGHVIIDLRDEAPRDSLNKSGSLEAYCGAYAVIQRTQSALQGGKESSLRQRLAQGLPLTPLMIAEEAEAGDQLARQIIFDTARYLAIGIVTLVHTIDPNIVVLGGAMTFGGQGHPLGEEFLACIQREARQRMIASLRDQVKIQFAALGGDAGFIGAAGLARRDHGRAS
jgi:glucokinase